MKRNLKMKCSSCGHWNRVPVSKIFLEQPSPEPKVQVLIPMYEPLEATKCKKCGKIIAEPNELIRIGKRDDENGEQLAQGISRVSREETSESTKIHGQIYDTEFKQ